MSEILTLPDATMPEMVAATLAGPVVCDPIYHALSWGELVQLGLAMREQEQQAQQVLLHCVRRVLEIAGERVTDRARALREYAGELGYTLGYLWQFARVALILRPADQEQYPQLTTGHLYEAALRTSLPGEEPTAPERRERTLAVLNAAADRNLSRRETSRLAGAIREEARVRELPTGEALETLAQTLPIPQPYFQQASAAFRSDLGDRLRQEEPGTWEMILECAESAFLNLRGAWYISPRGE